MATKKGIVKWIRKQCELLKPETYEAARKFYEPQIEKDEHGRKRIIAGDWVKFPVNHARRVKRIYKREGKEGVDRYFRKRGFKLVKQ